MLAEYCYINYFVSLQPFSIFNLRIDESFTSGPRSDDSFQYRSMILERGSINHLPSGEVVGLVNLLP